MSPSGDSLYLVSSDTNEFIENNFENATQKLIKEQKSFKQINNHKKEKI